MDSQVVFVTTHAPMIEKVQIAVQEQLEQLPRKEIAEKALENSLYILLQSDEDALKLINMHHEFIHRLDTYYLYYYKKNLKDYNKIIISIFESLSYPKNEETKYQPNNQKRSLKKNG